jgi:hypothetical protein
MPLLIDAAAHQGGLLLAILGYGTRADTLIWLTDPADIRLATDTPDALARSIAAAFRGIITRLPRQREGHLLAVVVEFDDLGLDLLAGRDHVGRLADPVGSELADVDDAFGSVPEIDVGE